MKLSGFLQTKIKSLKKAFLIVVFSIVANIGYSSHLAGGSITWQCLGNGLYEVELTLFRDCEGAGLGSQQTITASSMCQNMDITLSRQSVTEVSQLCQSELPNSSCNGGQLPALQEIVYSAQVDLSVCECWDFSWRSGNRNYNITNLQSPGSKNFYIESSLCQPNNACNDGVQFTNQPFPYTCINQQVTYNFGIVESDGDNLTYEFVCALDNQNSTIPYLAGYSCGSPMSGITIDSNSGAITVTPNTIGNFVVVVLVKEYRNNVLIGSYMRDVQFIVLDCENEAPITINGIENVSGDATYKNANELDLCVGDAFCFDVVFDDANSLDIITLSSNIAQIMPGATFNQSGTNPATASICWTIPMNPDNNYYIEIKAEDDYCPIQGVNSHLVTLNIYPSISLSANKTTICQGEDVIITASDADSYHWSHSLSAIKSHTVSPTSNTTYQVIGSFNNGSCSDTATIDIEVLDSPTINAGPDQTICKGQETQLNASTNGTDYYWSPINNLTCDECLTPSVVNLTQTTTFIFTSYNNAGCESTDEVTVFIEPLPTVQTNGDQAMCSGNNVQLTATGANTYTWAPSSGLSCTNCPNPIASPITTTTYTVVGQSAFGCENSESLTVTVYPTLFVDAGSGAALCDGTPATIGGNPTAYGGTAPYTYAWTPSQDLSCTNCANPLVTPSGNINYTVNVTDNNGCTGSDDVNLVVLPAPNHVDNGDFEDGNVPTERSQINLAPTWFDATGTADLFDERVTCAQSCTDLLAFECVDIPCNHFGYQDIRESGQRYSGLRGAIGLDATIHAEYGGDTLVDEMFNIMVEGMETKLNTVLDQNKTYKLTFYASLAEQGEIDTLLVASFANLQVKLSVGASTKEYFQPTDVEPLFSAQVSDLTNWTKFTYTFSPTQAFDHLIIESDFSKIGAYVFAQMSNDSIDAHEIANSGLWINSYTFIDDISIVEVCSYAVPIADAGPDRYLCANDSVTIGGSPTAYDGTPGYTYNWSPTTGLDCSTCANPKAKPNSNTTYTVTVTDANGATDNSSTTVYISNPAFTIASERILCDNATVFIGNDDGAFGGIAPYTYQWQPVVKLSCSDCANPEASPSRQDSLVYYVTVTDSVGCTYNDSVLIRLVNSPFIDTIQVVAPAICPNDSTLLNALVSGGQPDYTFSWSPDSSVSEPNKALTYVTPTVSTMYVVIVTDANGCAQQDSVYTKVFGIDAGNDAKVCRGDSITLGGNPTAFDGTAPYTYLWEGNGDLSCTTCPNPKTSPATGHTFRYYLTVTDSNGCQLEDEVVLQYNNNPTANADYGTSECDSTYVSLGGTTVASGGKEPYSYLWSPENTFNPTSKAYTANPTVQLLDSATTFVITVTDVNGCWGQDSATYYTYVCHQGSGGNGCCDSIGCPPCTPPGCTDVLKANAGDDIRLCSNSCDTIGGTPKKCPRFTYTWTPATGLSCTTCANPVACPTVTTTYEFTVYEGSNKSKDIVTVYVDGPVVDAGPDNITLCSDSTVQIGGEPTALGGESPYTYQWLPSAGLDDPTASNPYASPTSTTTYTVTATDANGCTDSDSIEVIAYPVPMADAGRDTVVCSGDQYIMGGTPSGNGGTGTLVYTWNPGDYLSGIHQAKPTLTAPLVTTTSSITYQLLVYDDNYCEGHDEVTIILSPKPAVDAGDQMVSMCKDDSVLIGTPALDSTTYQWSPTTGLACATCAETMASPNATQTYVLTSYNINGCSSSDSIVVNVYNEVFVNAGPDIALCFDDCSTIGNNPAATGGISPYRYQWTPSQGLSDATIAQPTLCASSFNASGTYTYTLTVTDANGCTGTASMTVDVTSGNNYVNNGDFDQGPTAELRGQIENATDWFKATGTPDLFDALTNSCTLGCPNSVLDINCVGVPCNHFGTQDHDSNLGNNERYTGVWAALGVKIDFVDPFASSIDLVNALLDAARNNIDIELFVEGVETKLAQPFIPGTAYNISFWVSKAEKGQVEDLFVSDNAGFVVKTSVLPATHPLYNPVDAKIIYTGSTSDETNWQHVSFQYTFNQPFEHLIIESTLDMVNILQSENSILSDLISSDGSISTTITDLIGGSTEFLDERTSFLSQSYMYIDGVEVKEVCAKDSIYVQAFNNDSICLGSCSNISATGNGTSYVWSQTTGLQDPYSANTSACPDKTTTYTVTATDRSGNTASDQVTITVLDTPMAHAGEDLALCANQCEQIGGNPSASSGTAPYTYQWSNGSTVANPTVCEADAGVYWLIVTDANGCQSDPDSITVTGGATTNLLSNGGFEVGNDIPENRNELNRATDWFAAAGSPDLFDSRTGSCAITGCGTTPLDMNCVGLPCNHFGYQKHRNTVTTERYAGVYFAIGGPDAPSSKYLERIQIDTTDLNIVVEGIETKLTTPLSTNENYTISFYINKAEKGELGTTSINSEAYFKVKLSTSPAYSGGNLLNELPYTPVDVDEFYFNKITDENNWVLVSFSIKPTKAYEYLIIESAYPDLDLLESSYSLSLAELLSTNEIGLESYLFIDDVSISETCFIDSNLIADAGVDKSFCGAGLTGVMIGGIPTALGGTAPYTYKWTRVGGGAPYLSSTTVANPVASPFSSATYQVEVTDAYGLIATDQVDVFYDKDLVIDAGPDVLQCDASCVTIGGNPTIKKGSGNYTYTWTPSSYMSGSSTIANPTVCLPSGSQTYNISVRDNVSGCTLTDQVKVTRGSAGSDLVPNGNFSNGSIPTDRNQVDSRASNWITASGTPDLFDERANCGTPCLEPQHVDIPNNYYGNQPHRPSTANNDRYIGLWYMELGNKETAAIAFDAAILDGLSVDLRDEILYRVDTLTSDSIDPYAKPLVFVEAVEVKLNQNFVKDEVYIITYYAAIGDVGKIQVNPATLEYNLLDELISDLLDVGFANVLFQDYINVLVKAQEVEVYNAHYAATDGVVISNKRITYQNNNGWQKVEFTFRPKKAYSHIILETYNPIVNIDGARYPSPESYVYIDDISIVKACGNEAVDSHKALVQEMEGSLLDKNSLLNIFPNPAQNVLNVHFKGEDTDVLQVEIQDLNGSIIKPSFNVYLDENGKTTLDLSEFANGVYMLKAMSGDEYFVQRLVIMNK